MLLPGLAEPGPRAPRDAPYHVLLVEDDPQDLRLTQAHLARMSRFNHRVTTAGSLQETFTALAVGDIDVVLLDLGLPDSQGLATLSRVVAVHREVPVVVLTGHDDEEAAILAARFGAQDYVVKGRTQGILEHVLRYAIERHAIFRGQLSAGPRGVPA